MKLVDADALNLDRDVSDYLSWNLRNPNYPQEIITVRQLLSHTSSLRDGDRYFIAYGEGKLETFIPTSNFWDDGVHFASGANKAPGHYFVYSNLNFGVLGEVIEQVSGRRFDFYMEEAVLKPMSLTARFNPCEIPKSSLLLLSGNIKVTGIGHRRKLGATSRCRLADLLLWNGDW